MNKDRAPATPCLHISTKLWRHVEQILRRADSHLSKATSTEAPHVADLHQPEEVCTATVPYAVTRFIDEGGQGVQSRCVVVMENVVRGQHRLAGREKPSHQVCPVMQVTGSNIVHRFNLSKRFLVDPRFEKPG